MNTIWSVTISNFPAFILLGGILGCCLHMLIRKVKPSYRPGWIYSVLLSVVMFSTSIAYEYGTGSDKLIEPLKIAWGELSSDDKKAYRELTRLLESGATINAINIARPDLTPYINALQHKKFLGLYGLWFLMTLALTTVVVQRHKLAGLFEVAKGKAVQYAPGIIVAGLFMLLLFPPVAIHKNGIDFHIGHQFIFTMNDYVHIQVGRLLVYICLLGLLILVRLKVKKASV